MQDGARTMQARADGSDRTAEMGSGSRVIEIFEIAEHDHFAIFRRKPENGRANRVELLLLLEIGEENFFLRRGRNRLSEIAAYVIASDANQIRLQRTTVCGIVLQPAEQRHEHVLRDLFRYLAVA